MTTGRDLTTAVGFRNGLLGQGLEFSLFAATPVLVPGPCSPHGGWRRIPLKRDIIETSVKSPVSRRHLRLGGAPKVATESSRAGLSLHLAGHLPPHCITG